MREKKSISCKNSNAGYLEQDEAEFCDTPTVDRNIVSYESALT